MKWLWKPLTRCQLIYTSIHWIRLSFSTFCSFAELIWPWGKERAFWLMNLEKAAVSRVKWQRTKRNAQRLKRRKRRTTQQAESAKKTVSGIFFLLETWAYLIPSLLFSLWILPSVSFAQVLAQCGFFSPLIVTVTRMNKTTKHTGNPLQFFALIPMSR